MRSTWAALAASLVVVTLTSCGSGGDVGSASCAALLRLDGRTYTGVGDLVRDPPTTGRHAEASVPSCQDTGDPDDAVRATAITVHELVGVPMGDAVLADGGLYVRDGIDLPAAAQAWFTAPTCASTGDVDLTAVWIGVLAEDGQMVRGRDLDPPYVLTVHVTDGPAEYVGTTIEVHADAATSPELGRRDVRTSLRKGGQVIARVRCDEGRFDALSLRTP